jgi:CRISPR/Cas system CSM-associated protein Csm3 (group 7 of RAMP superfamily)
MNQALSTLQENYLKRHQQRKQRRIIKRIIVYGNLVLQTPTCLGSGDAESPTDMAVLRDSISDRALLTGASLAGALRNYLWEYQNGYNQFSDKSVQGLADLLFGGSRSDDDGEQSALIVDDAISSSIPIMELRDGVKIQAETGTAEDGAKYDLEFIAAGTEFKLAFELLIEQEHNEAELSQALALALRGLENGEISIGTKKRRGFGCCQIKQWRVWKFDLQQDVDRVAWLKFDHADREVFDENSKSFIAEALGVTLAQSDYRDHFCIHATFTLESPLLIRSGQDSIGLAPDVVHLKSHRGGLDIPQPIISGTSLTGVMRHRAERILNTLGKSTEMLNLMFGFVDENKEAEAARASRLVVHESTITGTTHDLVQNRVAIDRFTGGAYHGALFSEQPVFGSNDTKVELKLELRNPQEAEIGLLLLLLKDLWTGDLPVGGGRSIGRGRLKGQSATITRHYPDSTTATTWDIAQQNDSLTVSDAAALEEFVQALVSPTGGQQL